MFEGLDMNALMEQAQKLQADMLKAQQEQAAKSFEGNAGGGLVKVTVSGAGELTDVQIKPEAWDPDDTETLGALVVAAFRTAKEQADDAMKAGMPEMPQMPGMPGAPGGIGF
ncbi:hypothetical protein GCM10028820_15020 [Tessaracoccus terricola]